MSRYPKAEWVPWLYSGPNGGPNFYKGQNQPAAVVLHVMEGYARTARQWALSGHYGASWTFTVARDGSVMQHLEFVDGGYHAGIPVSAPNPTWTLWRGHGRNVNTYTIGIEHEGFSGDAFPEAQAVASRDLCRWIAGELGVPFDRDHFPAHADIDLINRPNDFHPPAMREQFYAYLFEEEDMPTKEEWEALKLRVFAGSERGGETREQRLAYADYQLALDAQSVLDTAASVAANLKDHIDNHSAGVHPGGLKRGDKVTLT